MKQTKGSKKLETFRTRCQITQAKLAGEIGIFPATLSDLMRGKRLPSLETAVRIELVTDGSVKPRDWLVGA
jgi:DNA-binding XRE family transcriptional regulator